MKTTSLRTQKEERRCANNFCETNTRCDELIMKKHKTSACISLGICIASSLLLLVWLFTFPQFFTWFYFDYHGLPHDPHAVAHVLNTVIACFYACAPVAAVGLGLLIALLRNIIKERLFIQRNVTYLLIISWCCYAVMLITLICGLRYLPLMIITFAMGVVGTLLRVVKNLVHAAVALQEENSLTI